MVNGDTLQLHKSYIQYEYNFSLGFRKNCYKCGDPGHIAKDCPEEQGKIILLFNQVFFTHVNFFFYFLAMCYSCNEPGHIARDCPNDADSGMTGNKSCFTCGRIGHISQNCPDGDSNDTEKNSSRKGTGSFNEELGRNIILMYLIAIVCLHLPLLH